MENAKYYSVSAINRYIYHKFDVDVNLQEVYVKGEISNFKWSGKHCYFSLKDAESELSAMFFYPANTTLKFQPRDGMSVQIIGKIQVYQKRGTYSIVVRQMIEEGVGILYQQFLDLKEKLFKEGMFDEDKKLPIPEYPEKVAVITAPTGEAIRDIISTFNRRLPLAEIKLYPALVQGADAPADLIKALNKVYYDNEADVIIIGRGGGSFEDLACFNDERLARTLFASPIPTVSAIGHEGDYTICDFVSSFRAPTPTGAAMKLTKDKKDVIQMVDDTTYLLVSSMKHKLINDYNNYDRLVNSHMLSRFDEYLNNFEEKVTNLPADLMVLGFGMNDGRAESKDYLQRTETMVNKFKEKNPDGEVILIATTLPNTESDWVRNQPLFAAELYKLEEKYPFVAVADMTDMHKTLLATGKRYRDMTGNNVNHPNDFLGRIYAQVLLKTILG